MKYCILESITQSRQYLMGEYIILIFSLSEKNGKIIKHEIEAV